MTLFRCAFIRYYKVFHDQTTEARKHVLKTFGSPYDVFNYSNSTFSRSDFSATKNVNELSNSFACRHGLELSLGAIWVSKNFQKVFVKKLSKNELKMVPKSDQKVLKKRSKNRSIFGPKNEPKTTSETVKKWAQKANEKTIKKWSSWFKTLIRNSLRFSIPMAP